MTGESCAIQSNSLETPFRAKAGLAVNSTRFYNALVRRTSYDSVGGAKPFARARIDSTVSARHYWIPPYSPATPPSQSRCPPNIRSRDDHQKSSRFLLLMFCRSHPFPGPRSDSEHSTVQIHSWTDIHPQILVVRQKFFSSLTNFKMRSLRFSSFTFMRELSPPNQRRGKICGRAHPTPNTIATTRPPAMFPFFISASRPLLSDQTAKLRS